MQTFAIIGAGEAGVAAAGALRSHGFKGRLVLIDADRRHPYARPPLSKAVLTENAGPEGIRSTGWFEDHAIDLMLGVRVNEINAASRQLIIEGHSTATLAYDKLLIATGARIRRLSFLGTASESAAYLRTFDDALTLKQRLAEADTIAVVGGGVIGLEVASSACKLGKRVIVLEAAERLMNRAVSADVSAELLQLHFAKGVDVRFGVRLVGAEFDGDRARLALDTGEWINSDFIVAGIGVDPDVELARAMGCKISNGIEVDGNGLTSIDDVFAAGDVALFPHPVFEQQVRIESWQHARKHGAHVGAAMLGHITPYEEIPWFWTDQHGVNVQVAGLPNAADSHIVRGKTRLHFAGERLVGVTTFDNGRDIRPASKLIAARWQADLARVTGSEPLSSFLLARPLPQ